MNKQASQVAGVPIFDLENKVAIVTGAARGIGRESHGHMRGMAANLRLLISSRGNLIKPERIS